MRYYLLLFLTILLTILVHLLFLEYIPVFGVGPQILLISVIYFSLRYGPMFGQVYGFISGLCLDGFVMTVFGVHSLVFTFVGYYYGKLSNKLDEDNFGVQMLLVFLASCALVGFMMLTSVLFNAKSDISLAEAVTSPLYTVLLTPFFIKILAVWVNRIEKWSGKTNLV